MKNIILIAILSFGLLSMNVVSIKQTNSVIIEDSISEKFDIKIKNDTDSDVKVINAGISDDYAYRTYIKPAEKEIEKNNREVGRDCRDVLKEDKTRYKKLLGIK